MNIGQDRLKATPKQERQKVNLFHQYISG